jgi:hypothetical protein
MLKFPYKWIVVIICTVVFIDIFIGIINDNYFHKITHGIYGSINRTLTEEYQTLILGSSTAQSHYDPEILSQYTGIKTVNGGIGGYGIFLNYALLSERIKYDAPDILILDIAPNVISDPIRYEKLDKLLPYYNDYESFKEIVALNNRFLGVFGLANSIKYNSSLYNLFRTVYKRKRINENGYVPITGKLKEPLLQPMSAVAIEPDTTQIMYFEKIIQLCQGNNIDLYVVVSPSYIPFDPNHLILEDYIRICIDNNVDYHDFSFQKEFSKNNRLFFDQIHLNQSGAELFTKYICLILDRQHTD